MADWRKVVSSPSTGFTMDTGSGILWEGTDDTTTNQTLLIAAESQDSSDHTITLPADSGTVALTGAGSQYFNGSVSCHGVVSSTDGNAGTAGAIQLIANGVIKFQGATNLNGFYTELGTIDPTGTNLVKLPDAAGTIALTSQLHIQNTDTGTLSQSFGINTDTTGADFVILNPQLGTADKTMSLWSSESGITDSRNIYLPDATGTVALEEYVDAANYVTNDADDTMAGTLTIDKNSTETSTATTKGLVVDFDHTGSTVNNQTLIGLDISAISGTTIGGSQTLYGIKTFAQLTCASGSNQTTNTYGLYATATGNVNAMFDYATGAYLKAYGTDLNTGLYINCEDGGDDLKIVSSAAGGSFCKIQVTTLGATTLTTNQTAGNGGANLNFDIDGGIVLDSFSGITGDCIKDQDTMSSDSDVHLASQQSIKAYADYIGGTKLSLSGGVLTGDITSQESNFSIVRANTSGATSSMTIGSTNAGAGIGAISLNADKISGTTIKTEDDMASDSGIHLASQQSIKAYVDASMYDNRVCNYSTTSASLVYLPLCGYVLEGSSQTGANEFRAMIMPYDGSLARIIWRSEVEQTSGTFRFVMLISDDGTEIPGDTNFRTSIASFTLAANTSYVHDPGVTQAFDGLGGGNQTNTFSKGQIIAFGIDPTVAPVDVNCTLVFKYNTTT